MEINRPPPRPGTGSAKRSSDEAQHLKKRAQFAMNRRQRCLSSGSTRGAFGPMDVNDAHNNKEIYEVQKAAMHNNLSNINVPPSEVKLGSAKKNTMHSRRHDDEEYAAPSSHEQSFSSNGFSNAYSPRRRPSPDGNTSFAFSPSPSYNNIKAATDQEAEINKFSKFSGGYGTQNNSWDEDSYDSNVISVEIEDVSFYQTVMRTVFYDPTKPEFTSLQQSSWAVLIGIFMGVLTALWSMAVEASVEFFWSTLPEFLLEQGIFTDLDGHLPLPHYMWICPAIFGGLLAYVTAEYSENGKTIPGQNEWIEQLHRVGLMDHRRFWPCIIISTLGMASGLSLGPEMPLVLVAGMVGSWVALRTKQSVLSARVMNLTAAAAGIGGFFGFPMAGALFVLELPHRMGLQYFEALSPAVLSSIISVITNRWVSNKQKVEGYFDYPFLAEKLPSNIFYTAVIYGVVGTFVGILYADGVVFCKHWVHDWFHAPHDHDDDEHAHDDDGLYHDETSALMGSNHNLEREKYPRKKEPAGCFTRISRWFTNLFGIEHEPYRAAIAGVMCGIIVGVNCMFLPHQLFWGEAQLQTLIDKGRTPLPIFEYGDEPTAILTAYGYCMIDPDDERAQVQGFSIACTGMMSITKILTIGLSLGTGVCGGHFWGPLYTGCAAAHFFTDIVALFAEESALAKQISEFPCVAILCIMGATHVVTYRCHTAIMLVLTLTISSFSTANKEGSTAGDYSAVFPLLVVACYMPVILARGTVFYAKQRCRGDIVAVAEVLCEPNKELITYDEVSDYSYDASYGDDESMSSGLSVGEESGTKQRVVRGLGEMRNSTAGMGTTDPLGISLHSNTHVRKPSNDPLAVSQHSAGNLSRRSNRSGSQNGSRRSVRRMRSFGQVEDFQPNILGQARESSRPNTPKGPSLPRHRRTGSNMSVSSLEGNF